MMIPPVIVTVPPTGTSPLHTTPVTPIDKVPELAVSFPASLTWSAVLGEVKLTLIPVYGVCPVLVIVVVSFTVAPGVAVPALGVETIVSCDTVTVAVHRGSVAPAGQLLPGVVEVTVSVRTWPPVSGLLTVTEYVIVAEPPGDRLPVHVSTGAAYDTDPTVATASPS